MVLQAKASVISISSGSEDEHVNNWKDETTGLSDDDERREKQVC